MNTDRLKRGNEIQATLKTLQKAKTICEDLLNETTQVRGIIRIPEKRLGSSQYMPGLDADELLGIFGAAFIREESKFLTTKMLWKINEQIATLQKEFDQL